ncbi:MAG: ferric reductase-like transmembrane domain-containing protein [Sandaracinaceae bacterium]|nr:ferric reductase-like transmembrane domain-containing protein [Sandaracinaceae bacterium]
MTARALPLAPYALAALAAAAVIALGVGQPWDVERDLVWIRGTAWCALVALGLALCASPVGAVLVRLGRASPRAVTAARRALGISAGALATLHAGLALATWLSDAWHLALELAWVRSGVLAWAILAALWLTSFPRVVAALRVTLWKPLHRLAYVAFALAVHHALLSPLAPRAPVLSLAALVAALGVLRLVRPRARPG